MVVNLWQENVTFVFYAVSEQRLSDLFVIQWMKGNSMVIIMRDVYVIKYVDIFFY